MVLRPEAPIETDRLILRPFTADDFDDFRAYDSRPDVARYLPWDTRDHTAGEEAFDQYLGRSAIENEGDGLVLAMVSRENGKVIGQVSLQWHSRVHRHGEIGFILNPEYHGHGLAAEAAVVMLRLGFEELGLHRITGHCDARNHSSARLMARLGMRQEAHLVENEFIKGEWTDELVYAMLDREWEAQRPSAT